MTKYDSGDSQTSSSHWQLERQPIHLDQQSLNGSSHVSIVTRTWGDLIQDVSVKLFLLLIHIEICRHWVKQITHFSLDVPPIGLNRKKKILFYFLFPQKRGNSSVRLSLRLDCKSSTLYSWELFLKIDRPFPDHTLSLSVYWLVQLLLSSLVNASLDSI